MRCAFLIVVSYSRLCRHGTAVLFLVIVVRAAPTPLLLEPIPDIVVHTPISVLSVAVSG